METTMDIEEYVNEDGDTVIEHITGLETLFGERSEDPCEHSQHGVRKDGHHGPGEWLLECHVACCTGDGDLRYMLVCDRYKRQLMDSGRSITCMRCGTEGIAPEEWYTVLGRKGVDF